MPNPPEKILFKFTTFIMQNENSVLDYLLDTIYEARTPPDTTLTLTPTDNLKKLVIICVSVLSNKTDIGHA